MKAAFIPILMGLIYVCFVPTVRADTISCATAKNDQSQGGALIGKAQSFTTPNDGSNRTLDTVQVDLSSFGAQGSDQVYAVLYSASGDLPIVGLSTSTAIAANTLPSFSTFTTQTFTFVTKPTLLPNTNYAVVIADPDGDRTADGSREISVATNDSDVCAGKQSGNDSRSGSGTPWQFGSLAGGGVDFTPYSFSFTIIVPPAAPNGPAVFFFKNFLRLKGGFFRLK